MNQQRVKWHANRDKPTTLNPSRRRRDFRRAVQELDNAFPTIRDERYAEIGDDVNHVRRERILTHTVYVNPSRSLIKKVSGELAKAKEFERFVQHDPRVPFEIVQLKMTKNKTVMQYVKKPSLAAMRTFLTTPSFEYQLPYPENAYCGKLLRGAIKAGISAPKLLMGIESAEKYLIEAWQKFSGKDHAIFASDNFIVCGVNPQGKLKIAFIDI